MKAIIADTSCLILYAKIDQLGMLKATFPTLMVTKEVAAEFGEMPAWINVRQVANTSQYFDLARDLGKGEASSITLALEHDDSLLIIDEKKGRKVASEMKVEIIGSLGVLLKAKEKGVIRSVSEIMAQIDQTNFRISPMIREKVLEQAGER